LTTKPVLTGAEQAVSRTELNPVDFLRRGVAVFPTRVAVVHGKRRVTYAELGERVDRMASALRRRGLEKHDRVAVLCPNIPAPLEAHFGVPAAGGVLVPLNVRLSAEEIRYILEHSGARFLFVDAELLHLVEDAPEGLELVRVDDTGAPGDPYEDFLLEADPEGVESWLADEEEPISINYTSGTTGRPKGVVCTYRGAYLNALGEFVGVGLGGHPVYLWTLPMFHCNGWCFPWAVTAAGGRHVCLRKLDPARIWELLREEGVTHYNGAPTVQVAVVNAPEAAPLPHPVTVAIGGAPPSPTILARMRELNLHAVHVYGLTETYGPTTVSPEQETWSQLPPEQRAKLLARQGQAYISSDLIRVVDDEITDVPQDGETMGEVIMRGNNLMSGYFDDEAATAAAFRGDWFHSGDLAVWHADGNIELRDRSKDVIISGGENISSIELEQTIDAHPAVLECAVIAIPNEHWGERPKAFVTLRDGSEATEEALIAFCREHLAHYKCPDAIEFGPLPKTSTGKVQKFVLREREWAGYEKRIGAA
jgi:acyl-CoA synthetase (AMP-forming)/AMP-acid ligase II